jgi:hypothetical protein
MREKVSGNSAQPDKAFTVLWLPRWLLSYQFRDLYEGGSTFMTYHKFFLNYARKNRRRFKNEVRHLND